MKKVTKIITGVSTLSLIVAVPVVSTQIQAQKRDVKIQNINHDYVGPYKNYQPAENRIHLWYYDIYGKEGEKWDNESNVITDLRNFHFFVPSKDHKVIAKIGVKTKGDLNNLSLSHLEIEVYTKEAKKQKVTNMWFTNVVNQNLKHLTGINKEIYIDIESVMDY
ncbi:MAG: hypothetical protein HRT99_03435 [Mycoplasmatales bacterium]|nr:hypothetical protein [Mycoplasmatales bacterium]